MKGMLLRAKRLYLLGLLAIDDLRQWRVVVIRRAAMRRLAVNVILRSDLAEAEQRARMQADISLRLANDLVASQAAQQQFFLKSLSLERELAAVSRRLAIVQKRLREGAEN